MAAAVMASIPARAMRIGGSSAPSCKSRSRKKFLLGGEIYNRTTMTTGGRDDTAFNLGTVIDFTGHQHLLFSAGRSIDGPTDFQCYIA